MKVTRRKVRKGTQSCWECKRRKVRCIFASAEHAICNHCRRRGTACVSQDLPDTRIPPSSNSTTDDIEGTPLPRSIPSSRGAGKYDEICRDLISAWPSEEELDFICTLPTGIAAPLYWGVCAPYDDFIIQNPPPPRDMLQLPPLGSHPVLIARKLLVLATFLQGIPPSALRDLGSLGSSYREIAYRAIEVVRLVTTNDELICCAEGIECAMMETMYQNYAGNLDKAWMAIRRASAAAQLMGMQRGANSPGLRFIEPATRANFDSDHISFRLVQMERYLAVMLGIPHGPLDERFAAPEVLEGCRDILRMERMHCLIAGRILSRTDAVINDLPKTQELDSLLQTAAAEMSAQWWLNPTFANKDEILGDTIRILTQFTHYHLVARLHLSYMLRYSPDHKYDHSKLTAVNASREILTRYITFRSSNPANFYCRGCDFLAFVASTIMCLGYISSRSEQQSSVLTFLSHSRLSDRGLMERTSEIIQSMVHENTTDVIATKLTRIIHYLLEVEANAASGAIYSTSSSTGNEGEIEGNLSQEGKALHIHIPYFGTINFERGGVTKTVQAEIDDIPLPPPIGTVRPSQLNGNEHEPLAWRQSYTDLGVGPLDLGTQPTFPSFSTADEDWYLQGIDIALFDSMFRGIEFPDVGGL
ncbi:hypothetical protein BJY04DRAFT_206615 [Aspergillus karnatakaensis]|uniref:uncharacterized protein n=1 Tax=Aspergillus karnatakaensis TaxID=1810916 RepID=UPI003CCD0339